MAFAILNLIGPYAAGVCIYGIVILATMLISHSFLSDDVWFWIVFTVIGVGVAASGAAWVYQWNKMRIIDRETQNLLQQMGQMEQMGGPFIPTQQMQ